MQLTTQLLHERSIDQVWQKLFGLQVNTKYMALARAMLSYEKQCFSQWQEKVDQTAIQHLKLPILQENADSNRCKLTPQLLIA